MGKKYKYSKQQLAQMIHDIDWGGVPLEEHQQHYMDLLEDAGDIPLWSPVTLKPFLKELIQIESETLAEFNRPDDGTLWGYLRDANPGEQNEITFTSFSKAFDYLKNDLPRDDIHYRAIYRNPSESHDFVEVYYNNKGVATSIWGGNYGWRLDDMRKIYDEFKIR